jgi:hypothetical protein
MAASGGLAARGSRVKLRQRKIIVLTIAVIAARVWRGARGDLTTMIGENEDEDRFRISCCPFIYTRDTRFSQGFA